MANPFGGNHKHGHTRGGRSTSLYKIWESMIERCRNHNRLDFKNYGGRGIKVCDRWLKFENFLSDVGERPEGCSIDRINVNDGYNPTNCRWASVKEQNTNKRGKNKYKGVSWSKHAAKWRAQIKIDGKSKTLGYFLNEEEAAKMYNKAAQCAWGEFAHLNEL